MPTVMVSAPEAETIGQRIKRLRLERGLTQRDLAVPGVSYAYISRVEAGSRVPSVKAIRKLARGLGVTADYLETGADLRADERLELRLAEAELGARLGEMDEPGLERAAEAVVREAEELGDAGLAARGRLVGARVASRSGQFARAIEQLDLAIQTGSVPPVVQPDVFVMLANCYRLVGRVEDATETLRRALAEVRGLPPADLSRARLAGALSDILEQLGDLEEARNLRAAATAAAPDPYARVRALWMLARDPELDDRPREKLRRLREALYLLESSEAALELARTQLHFANDALLGDRPETAAPHLEAAQLLFAHGADPKDRGSTRALRALYEVHQDNFEVGEQLAREAIELLGELPAEQAPAWLALGIAAGQRGDVETANSAFAGAVERLEAAHHSRAASKASRAWSAALRQAGRLEEALDVAERAAALAIEA